MLIAVINMHGPQFTGFFCLSGCPQPHHWEGKCNPRFLGLAGAKEESLHHPVCRRMIFNMLSAGFQYRRARERHRHFPPQTSIKTPLPRVDTVSQERWITQHGNVRKYLNRSHIGILSSVDMDSCFELRKKMSEVIQLLKLASTQLHANYQPECKCLY